MYAYYVSSVNFTSIIARSNYAYAGQVRWSLCPNRSINWEKWIRGLNLQDLLILTIFLTKQSPQNHFLYDLQSRSSQTWHLSVIPPKLIVVTNNCWFELPHGVSIFSHIAATGNIPPTIHIGGVTRMLLHTFATAVARAASNINFPPPSRLRLSRRRPDGGPNTIFVPSRAQNAPFWPAQLQSGHIRVPPSMAVGDLATVTRVPPPPQGENQLEGTSLPACMPRGSGTYPQLFQRILLSNTWLSYRLRP